MPRPSFLSEVRDPAQRRTLRRFALEGAASECVLWLTSGSVLTAWALALGGDAGTVSSVQSISTAAQAMHVPAAMASARGSRKRLVLAAMLVARLAWLPLAALALLGDVGPAGRALLLATCAIASIFSMFAQNAQGSWIGDAVPPSVRGRFFGTRTWVAALGGSVAALLIATLLDRGDRLEVAREASDGRVPLPVLGVLGVLVVGLGAISTLLLRGADEHTRDASTESLSSSLARARTQLADPALRRFLRYQILWGIAVAPGAAFFTMHVLTTMHGGYRLIAAHGIVVVVTRVMSAHVWGARVDRFGASRELALCSLGIGVMPLLWSVCDEHTWWPLALDAVLSGVLWGGQQIAVSAHPLGIGKPEDRPYVLAWSSLALGLSWAGASLVAGSLVRVLPDDVLGIGPFRLLFVFSGLARASCAWWALKLNASPAPTIVSGEATRSHA
ncbi:MAG: hypothetical protein J0L92_02410 [Deltaproteobacteria bacterium]|nr:hypothetical protein [Deltaproteobacteria bacterium]